MTLSALPVVRGKRDGKHSERGAMLFKKLSKKEEKEFRTYAQENNPPDMHHWFIYHPVCREEWEKRGIVLPARQKDIPDWNLCNGICIDMSVDTML
jgi:hypothetical protein